ncbi:MAG: DUF445 family protein [Proteobacteria bacterium]|nr:DUF445 family protein [Pseudomonadota bacterium]MBU1058773.1 DUF445 family protein [Pseudomonadota bacterium]
MPLSPADLIPVLHYAAPPFLGAFIGYLTNKVAIKMLFRPLEAKYFLGVRIPMTPGVIPSKRKELAENIGEMVGNHLLTSDEISRGLEKESFQQTLYDLIENRGEALLQKDLGPVSEIVPKEYHNYYQAAVQAVTSRTRESIHSFIDSKAFKDILENTIDEQFYRLLAADLQTFLPGQDRESAYGFLEKSLGRMLASPAMDEWVETFVQQKVYATLQQEKTPADIFPETMQELIVSSIENQTPVLLEKLAHIISEPEIRDRIVVGVRMGVESFVAGLGPMAALASGFLTPEVVEGKVRKYLEEKEEDIVDWLQNVEVQERVAKALRERSREFLNTPVVKIIGGDPGDMVEHFCNHLSRQLSALLREPETASAFASMVRDNIEIHIDGGKLSLGEILFDLVGDEGISRGREWLKNEVFSILASEKSRKTLDTMVGSLLTNLLNSPVGRLGRLLPAGVRDGIYESLRRMSSNMLAVEVPGLVDSLNIRHIVKEKVNSLDLMRLERLLLSIMEEQFKYINLFGALLGFLIGCLNLFFLNVL